MHVYIHMYPLIFLDIHTNIYIHIYTFLAYTHGDILLYFKKHAKNVNYPRYATDHYTHKDTDVKMQE